MRYFKTLTAIIFICSLSVTVTAQQKTTPPPEQRSGVQDVIRVVPELLPQAIRDSINMHPVDKNAEITSADQMSKNGNLVYKVNFLKDEETWSKTYDVEGRNIYKDEEQINPFDQNLIHY